MKSNDFEVVKFGCLGAIAMALLSILVFPLISFWICYFGGWITSGVIGDPLCNGLNTLFNTNRFTPDMIPWCAGALGWIGRYFKTFNLQDYNKMGQKL